ncbi:hypothetical protein [endosymbiont 'TC1' of Trimyema compressum]|uniref:hypothetical protein n=1 Tax=endosymbiont 'TC1' of Trimyema compressum TaxID=243899 RepID=UPI00155EA531|nr:hypothetical protein [endosymbiont 'TC1' of Trimyema compressum]
MGEIFLQLVLIGDGAKVGDMPSSPEKLKEYKKIKGFLLIQKLQILQEVLL